MKRCFFTTVALVLCLITISGTYAYYTVSSKAHNVITSGAVKIAVEEWQQTDKGIVPYPKDPIAIMPGRKISKIVKIRNLDKSSYVRARIEAMVLDADGNTRVLQQEETEKLLHLNINSNFWQKKENDEIWWYYYRSLSQDAVTEPLFDSVIFDGKEMGNIYQRCTVKIHVTAQAVQTDNNTAAAVTAAGWPKA